MLKNEKGTEILKGVLLEFGSQTHHSFGPAHFVGTSSIRFLRLDQADLIGNFKGHLSILRWLYWQGCPRNLHRKNLDLEELVILGLSRSMIHEKWNGWIQIQVEKYIISNFICQIVEEKLTLFLFYFMIESKLHTYLISHV